MKEKIWKGNRKYITIAIIVVVLTFAIGAFIITSLDGLMDVKNVNSVDVMVADKYINNDSEHYYVIVSSDGDLFDIVNITNTKDLYNQISVGKEYRFVTKQPFSADDKYIHILQVYNGTS